MLGQSTQKSILIDIKNLNHHNGTTDINSNNAAAQKMRLMKVSVVSSLFGKHHQGGFSKVIVAIVQVLQDKTKSDKLLSTKPYMIFASSSQDTCQL
jgi:hypothetical protein